MSEARSLAEQVLALRREPPRRSRAARSMGTINVQYFASVHCLLWQLRTLLGPGEGARPGVGLAWHVERQMTRYCACKYFFL